MKHSNLNLSSKIKVFWSSARICNQCRINGIQGSHTDFLICAVAKRLNVPIFTTDKDFLQYTKVISIGLYNMEPGKPHH